jgi:predicted DCC family thiol-disulfide oxidoreductase YuxK
VTKLVFGPGWAWATARSLGQYVLWAQLYFGIDPEPARLFVQYPRVVQMAAIGTLVLEAGFLPWILAKRDVTPFVLGLLGMHVGITVLMGPFFFDQIVFLLLFADWSRLLARLQADSTLDVVYDDRCRVCARSLYLVGLLDVGDTVRFYTYSTAPEAYRDRSGVDVETAIYAVRDGERHEGYSAFGAMFDHLRVFAPVAAVMSLPGVRHAGERAYASLAATRDRTATRSVDAGADE